MSNALSIAVTAIFAQNLVMAYMLCDGRFFKVLSSVRRWLVYGIAVTVATTLSSALSWVVYNVVLKPAGVPYLAPAAFVFILVVLEVICELALPRLAHAVYKQLSRLLPASAFSCAVLGVVFINVQLANHSFWGALFYGFCAGAGFLLALLTESCTMWRLKYCAPPKTFRGMPIVFIATAVVSLAYLGFSGMTINF